MFGFVSSNSSLVVITNSSNISNESTATSTAGGAEKYRSAKIWRAMLDLYNENQSEVDSDEE